MLGRMPRDGACNGLGRANNPVTITVTTKVTQLSTEQQYTSSFRSFQWPILPMALMLCMEQAWYLLCLLHFFFIRNKSMKPGGIMSAHQRETRDISHYFLHACPRELSGTPDKAKSSGNHITCV